MCQSRLFLQLMIVQSDDHIYSFNVVESFTQTVPKDPTRSQKNSFRMFRIFTYISIQMKLVYCIYDFNFNLLHLWDVKVPILPFLCSILTKVSSSLILSALLCTAGVYFTTQTICSFGSNLGILKTLQTNAMLFRLWSVHSPLKIR